MLQQPQPSTPNGGAMTSTVVCCHGKDRADLRMGEFEQTAGLAAARHSGKGQCCLSYLSGTCRNGSGCPHLHPVWNHVQRLKWVPTPSGPSAAQLSSTPGTGSVSVFVRRTNRSYDVPADEFNPTEHLSVAVRMGSGTACSHHLRETCLNGETCRFLHPSDRMLLQALRDELSPGHPVIARAASIAVAAAANGIRQVSPQQPRVSPGTQPHLPTASDDPIGFKLPGSLKHGGTAMTSHVAPTGLLGAMPPPVIASDDDGDDDDDDDEADHLLGLVHTDRERDLGGASAGRTSGGSRLPLGGGGGGGGLFRVEEGPGDTVLSPPLHATSITGFGNSTNSAVGAQRTPPVDLTFGWSPVLGNTALTSSGQQQGKGSTPPPVSWTTPTLRPAAQPFTPGVNSSMPLHMDPMSSVTEPIDPFDAFAAPAPMHHPLWTSPPSYDEYHSVAGQSGNITSSFGTPGSPGRQEPVTIAVTAESKEIYAVESKDFEPTRNLAATIRIGSGIACSHHLRDRCNNGSSCRFLHPIESVLATTLRAELGRNHPVLRATSANGLNTPGASASRLNNPGSAKSTPVVAATVPTEQPPSLFGPRATNASLSPNVAATAPSKLPKPKSQQTSSDAAAADAARVWKSADAPSLLDNDGTTSMPVPQQPAGAWAAVASRPAAPRSNAPELPSTSLTATTAPSAASGRGWETTSSAKPPTKNTPNSSVATPASEPRSAWPSAPARLPTGSEPSSPTGATPLSSATSSLKQAKQASQIPSSTTSSTTSSGGLDVDLARVLSAMWELRAEGHAFPYVRDVVKRIKPPVPPAPALALSLKRGVKEGLLTQRDEGGVSWRIALVGSLVGEPDEAMTADSEAPPQREKTEEFMSAPQQPPTVFAVMDSSKGKDVAVFLAAHGVDSGKPAPSVMMQAGARCPESLVCASCQEPRWSGSVKLLPCAHTLCTNCTLSKICKAKKIPTCPACITTTQSINGEEVTSAPAGIATLPIRCVKCGWKGTVVETHQCVERPLSEVALASLKTLVAKRQFEVAVEEASAILEGKSLWASAKLSGSVQAQLLALRAQAYMALGMCEQARADADAGLKADPKNASCFYFKGVALAEQGKHGQAISALQKALAVDPDHAEASALLSKVKEVKVAASDAQQSDTTFAEEPTATPAGKTTPPPAGSKSAASRPKKPIEKVHQFVATSVECAKAKDYGGVVECLSNTFDFFNSLDRRGRSIILARRAIGYYRLKKLSKARADAKKAADLNASLPTSWVFVVQLMALLKDGTTTSAAHGVVDLGDVGAEAMFPGLSRAELHIMCPPETPQQFDALMENEICQPFPAATHARKTVAAAITDGAWSDPEDTNSGSGTPGKKNTPPGAASSSALDGVNVFSTLRRVVAASPAQLSFEADMFHGENPVPMSHQLQAEFIMLQCKTPPSVENLRHLYRLLSLSCIVWTLVHYQDLGGLPPESVDLDSINVEIYWAKAVERFKYFFRQAVRRGVLPKWLVYEASRDAHLGILNRLAHVIDASRVSLLPPCYAEFALLVLADTPGASLMLRQTQFS